VDEEQRFAVMLHHGAKTKTVDTDDFLAVEKEKKYIIVFSSEARLSLYARKSSGVFACRPAHADSAGKKKKAFGWRQALQAFAVHVTGGEGFGV
jgi:hypothetical protein